MPDPQVEMAELEGLLASGRCQELIRRLDQLQPDIEDDPRRLPLLRLCGELAWRGQGPVGDLVLLARRLLADGAADGPDVAARAVRVAHVAGARATARALLDEADERWPGDDALSLARAQLRSGVLQGETRKQWEVAQALVQGELGAARQRLEQMAQEPGPDEARRWALLRLADVLRASGEERGAGEALLRVAGLVPEADGVALLRLGAALCLWAGGDHDGARGLLRELRDARADGAEQVYVGRVASGVLETLDRDPEGSAGGPRWRVAGHDRRPVTAATGQECHGLAMALFLLRHYGLDEHARRLEEEGPSLPSMAYLRRRLAGAGLDTIRLVVNEDRVEAALRTGGMLVLEEERPTRTGFLAVLGYDPVARLLRLRDPGRLAPLLRFFDDQTRRSALHGGGGLLVLPGDGAAGHGLEHDHRLELVDGCDLDSAGRVPSRARVAALASEAIEVFPELPMLHRRHGETLLEQMRLGDLEPAPAGPFERWLSATRLRFPEAEWPLQIYAAALESQGRFEEAGIAWSDATMRDPHDERNFIGQAAVLAKQGRLRAADQMLRRALTLRPGHRGAQVRRADIALAEGQLERAALAAELAVDLDGSDVEARLTRITVAERRGEQERAHGLLADLVREEPEHLFARVRLLRRLVHLGRWDEALSLGDEICTLAPGTPRVWETAAWVAWAAGEAELSLSRGMSGLQRCGPEPVLISTTVQTIATQLAAAGAAEATERLADLLASSPAALLDAASAFCHHGWYREGAALARRACTLVPGDPNPTWRLAQILLSEPAEKDAVEVDRLLTQTVSATGGYPYPRVILAWRRLEREGDAAGALELLEQADAMLAPAPVWYVQARALQALGRAAEAEGALARLPEVFPAGVLQTVGLLRLVRLFPLCQGLLELLLAHSPDNLDARQELARTRGAAGDRQEELDLLLEIEADDPRAVPPDWLLEAAEHTGRWDVLARVATSVIDTVERDSTDATDVWPMRAGRAGVRLVTTGAQTDVDQVLDRAPGHPAAAAALYRVLQGAGHPMAADHRQRAERLAPGLLRGLERGKGT